QLICSHVVDLVLSNIRVRIYKELVATALKLE
ncbi:MAG: hypothetical protein ACJAVY_002441, partial [Marinoscillum sp.]